MKRVATAHGPIIAAGLLAAGLALAADAPAPGEIARNDARALLERCRSAVRWIETGGREPAGEARRSDAQSCLAWVEGFHWGHAWLAWIMGTDMWYCLPEPFDPRASVQALVRYLDAHPDRLGDKAHVLTIAAFLDAYPCPTGHRPGSEEGARP